jgi:hypothetical protein
VARDIDGLLMLSAPPEPGLSHRASAEPCRDLDRAIGAAGVEDEHFIGPRGAANGPLDQHFFILRENRNRQRLLHAHAPFAIRALALARELPTTFR